MRGETRRLTAALLCAMYFVFTLVVCAPILMADLKSHLSWLMVTVTALHAASAWVVHQRAAELERTGLLTLLKMDRAPADELA